MAVFAAAARVAPGYRGAVLLREVLRSNGLMEHRVAVTDVEDRRTWLLRYCAGRSVLHVGCCDVPLFEPDTNLHIFLAQHTDRIDGLDISEEGIEVLRSHVDGDYFTDPSAITKEYEVVLVPEVLEHTPNPYEFLKGIFSVRARTYLFTAPHIQWYERARREGDVFLEQVHADHRAWYSPYTLLNTLSPFIDGEHDDVEVFLLKSTGSVAACVTTQLVPVPFAARRVEALHGVEHAIQIAADKAAAGDAAGALRILDLARAAHDDPSLVHARMKLLLELGQNMEALRCGVGWLRGHGRDARCMELCADALEALGDPAQATELRATARTLVQR